MRREKPQQQMEKVGAGGVPSLPASGTHDPPTHKAALARVFWDAGAQSKGLHA